MKKLALLAVMVLGSLSSFAAEEGYNRCDYIAQKLAGKYSVSLLKLDGNKTKVGQVSFAKTRSAYTFSATNLVVIGDVLLPGAPKKIKLEAVDGDCLLVGVGKIENNTLGSIVEGEDMKTFAVQVDDETFESVSFTKLKK